MTVSTLISQCIERQSVGHIGWQANLVAELHAESYARIEYAGWVDYYGESADGERWCVRVSK